MDGNALFKMCDVCRGKYKTYGTTKRKKWRDEKAKALAEMEREREEQNALRTEQGLPVCVLIPRHLIYVAYGLNSLCLPLER